MRQEQFLDVVDEATAHARFDAETAHLLPRAESVGLADCRTRVLAADVRAAVDVPGFDRSNVDGFAVRAADTFGAEELAPVHFDVAPLRLAAGEAPPATFELAQGTAVSIATGGVVPRGADAVVMVEHTRPAAGRIDGGIDVLRACTPGALITFAGSDIGRGEIVLRRGDRLTSRETGMLAAVGVAQVPVVRRPRVAVLSTGDEIRAPGEPLRVGDVYDANARIVADAVAESGGVAVPCGIVPDDAAMLRAKLAALLEPSADIDVVLLSGGTSKGEGDLNYRVVGELAASTPGSPGILVHGVALKPGKPVCLAVVGTVPVVILPGFPTSATFTYHEFVDPLVRRLSCEPRPARASVVARVPLRIPSVSGRTEYTLVHLVEGAGGLAAYPLGAGSGSVSAFARADGFVRIPDTTEYVEKGAEVEVRLLGAAHRPPDLVAIGSHCVGLDRLLGMLAGRGLRTRSVVIGSSGGLAALARGEGDVAGTHLLDVATDVYNDAFLPPGVRLLRGWGRRQGLVFRRGDARFTSRDIAAFRESVAAPGCRMVNRNAGSGTRVLLDRFLGDARPDGFHAQAKSHHAVAAAVAQGRADWGMTLDVVARDAGLEFLFVRDERFDLAVRAERWDSPGVCALRELLESPAGRTALRELGFVTG